MEKEVKKRWIWAIALFGALVVLDQSVKLYIKMHFDYGEAIQVIPRWFHIQFVENPGMAFGWMLPGAAGKVLLTSFRIVVFFAISYYLIRQIKHKANMGLVLCMSLILAGALGNILDSVFYGVLFDKGSLYDPAYDEFTPYLGIAEMNGQGYAPWLQGNVVDMLHCTKYITFPDWMPWVGGQTSALFPPVFNIADSAISVGIVLLLLFQKRFFAEGPQSSTRIIAEPEGVVS
jgi:signal peptidase II